MTQFASPHVRRALIIEDEFLIARPRTCYEQSTRRSSGRYLARRRSRGHRNCAMVREVCEVPIVFVTAQSDEDTVERVHEQVPGAPVLSKPVFRATLADALAEVTKH